jgi:hypothetical protein
MTAAATHTAGSVRTDTCAAGISARRRDVCAVLGSIWATRPALSAKGIYAGAQSTRHFAACAPAERMIEGHGLRTKGIYARVANQVFHSVPTRRVFEAGPPKMTARLLCIPLPLKNVRHGRLEFYVAPSPADHRQFFCFSNLAAKINMHMIVDQSALAASIGSESGRDCERSARRCDGGAGAGCWVSGARQTNQRRYRHRLRGFQKRRRP